MSSSSRLVRNRRPACCSAILSTTLVVLLTAISIASPAVARYAPPIPALSPARVPAVAAALLPRDYQDTVCKPPTQHLGDTIPPCVEIETIETTCTPNGTGPIFLAAHQQCMCRGSYFGDWPACLSCLFLHGFRTERDVGHWLGVLSAASASFCGAATPTAEFSDVFANIQATAATVLTGATVGSDSAASETAVSLYYTASGRQGPGRITGDAASATATALLTATRGPTSGAQGGGADGSSPGSPTQPAQGSGMGAGGSTPARGTPTNGSAPVSTTGSNDATFGPGMDWCFLVRAVGASIFLLLS